MKRFVKANIYAVIVGFTLSCLVLIFVLPYHFTTFQLHEQIEFIAIGLLGFANAVVLPLVDPSTTSSNSFEWRTLRLNFDLPSPTANMLLSPVVAFVIGALLTLLGVKVIKKLKRRNLPILILLPLFVNAFCGFGILFASLTDRKDPYYDPFDGISLKLDCEVLVSEFNGLRIIVHGAGVDNNQSFFLTTNDGGSSWRQIMSLGSHLYRPDCSTIDSFNESVFWFINGNVLTITFDGGHNWHFWHPSMLHPPTSFDWQLSDIVDVDFTTSEMGSLTLRRDNYSASSADIEPQSLVLHTNDGVTWRIGE